MLVEVLLLEGHRAGTCEVLLLALANVLLPECAPSGAREVSSGARESASSGAREVSPGAREGASSGAREGSSSGASSGV